MKKKIFSILFALVLSLSLVPAVPAMAAQAPVDLGSAGNFVILSKSGITTTGTTSIVGDIGVSPIAATAITGFGLILDSTNHFSTSDPSSLVTGKVYAADYAVPTPAKMTTAVLDMETAYTDAAGRTLPDFTELGAGNIGGLTLVPGLYKWSSVVTIPTDVTLLGDNNAVWIFQIAGTLDISSATSVILRGGAQAKNIFWQVADAVTLGTTSEFNGNILAKTNVAMNTGATLNGRALAQTAVTLIANAITVPDGPVAPPPPPPTPTPQAPVDLGSAGNFAVLAGSTVTNTALVTTLNNGDLGVSPGTAVTGGIVTETIHAGDAIAAQAQEDLATAYNNAAGQSTGTVTVAGNLGGRTLYPGLYKSTSSLEISSGDLTLDAQGDANAVFIFQMASTLTTTTGRQVILTNGAKASNVYWQVGTSATLETYSVFKGNILAYASITITTGATLEGRALARIGAVTLDGNIITVPAP
ncbi:MAG: ice-binding family protein [Pseudomonadota bacterium]